jgi:hypothetical protein
MQATISRYDESSRSGSVLTDTGVEIRFLRPGQRVRLDTTGTGETLTITAVHFITLP